MAVQVMVTWYGNNTWLLLSTFSLCFLLKYCLTLILDLLFLLPQNCSLKENISMFIVWAVIQKLSILRATSLYFDNYRLADLFFLRLHFVMCSIQSTIFSTLQKCYLWGFLWIYLFVYINDLDNFFDHYVHNFICRLKSCQEWCLLKWFVSLSFCLMFICFIFDAKSLSFETYNLIQVAINPTFRGCELNLLICKLQLVCSGTIGSK